MPVHVDNQHPRLRVDKRRIAGHLRSVLKALGRPNGVVDVSLVDDDAITAINAEWRGVDAVTDVVSFAFEEGEPMPGAEELLGDIVISLDTAARQADAMVAMIAQQPGGGVHPYDLASETLFLATHGLLHLLGHDHQKDEEAEAMEALERTLMATVTLAPLHALDRTDHAT
jgi:probable rRNA maturation factor